jgi:nicotinate-nucleotide adenylyltransferase
VTTLIFGGAFDPPHKEHIEIARAALAELKIKRLVFMPTADPPHKSTGTPFDVRVGLLQACGLPKGCEISMLERDAGGKNYTVDALPRWKQAFGNNIAMLIGGDSLIDLHKWYRAEDIASQIPLIVAVREGLDGTEAAADKWRARGADVTFLKYRPKGLSSTQMRTHISLYDDIPDGLKKAVFDRINEQKLYKKYQNVIEKLERELDDEKLAHSKSVARYAVRLNKRLKLPHDEVMLAGLLHDCKKQQKCYRDLIDPLALDTAVEHQTAGAIAALREYGVEYPAVVRAIACHCTGKPAMCELEKLIYVADKIEPTRDYPGVEDLRAACENDFENGFLQVLADQKKVIEKKKLDNEYPQSRETYEYYIKS